jgi:hypothetical protein
MERRRIGLVVGGGLVVLEAAGAAEGRATPVASKAPLLVFQGRHSGSADIWTACMDGSGARNLRPCGNGRLEDDAAADDVHDRERVRVAVRIDTDDVVQLICKHLQPTSNPSVGGISGVGLEQANRARHHCDGSRPTRRTGF